MKFVLLFIYIYICNMITKEKLIEILELYDIPLDKWGRNSAKTVNHLLNEINDNESTLEVKDNNLIRRVEFIGVKIFYTENDITYQLKEEKQVFKDGRTRVRNISSSVSEKKMKSEDPINAVIRGVKEELNIVINRNKVITDFTKIHEDESLSYPGLFSIRKGYYYIYHFNKEQFNSEGYIENQSDKSTYFKWTQI
jgi:hypothetical protein